MRIPLAVPVMALGLMSTSGRATDVKALIQEVRNTPEIKSGAPLGWNLHTTLALDTSGKMHAATDPFGKKEVLELVRYFESDHDWDPTLEAAMAVIFDVLDDKAEMAVDPLLKIAGNKAAPVHRRVRAINAIESIGKPAEGAVPRLEQLRTSRSASIRMAASRAILATGSKEGVPILVARLRAGKTSETEATLMGIAELGAQARAAGPSVLKYLHHDDWEIRAAAAQTLGFIEYEAAADDLISALGEEHDWRIVWSAAHALGRLKIRRAEAALAGLSKDHWFPPVRRAAVDALRLIRGESDAMESPLDVWNAEYTKLEGLESMEWKEREAIRFPVAPDLDEPLPIWTKVYHEAKVQWHGLRLADGYLAGCASGEWGGKLAFIDSDGKHPIPSPYHNVEFIYQNSGKSFAVLGYSSNGSNQGLILQLERGPGGKWISKPWRVLPGAPAFSLLLADRRLLVSCPAGGIVLVSPDGKMQSLTRAEALK